MTETERTTWRRGSLLVLMLAVCSLLTSCCNGPAPADVKADRDRWTAARDNTADGVIDPAEAPAWNQLLVEWDAKLAADEAAVGQQRGPKEVLAELVRVYGAAAVQVFLAPELQTRAPELFRLADRDGDLVLSEGELLSIDPTDPVFALVVASTVRRLLQR